jgi:hypothetical protein
MAIMDRFKKKNEKYAKDFDKGDTPMPPSAWRSATRT